MLNTDHPCLLQHLLEDEKAWQALGFLALFFQGALCPSELSLRIIGIALTSSLDLPVHFLAILK